MNDTHYRKLERMYLGAPCNQGLDELRLEIAEGTAVASFVTGRAQQHALGAMHGAYYFKMMDDAAFFAVSSIVFDVFVLTASFNVELFRPVGEGRVECRGRVTKPGSTILFAESTLIGPDGKELGRGSGTFAKSQAPLASAPGYA